MGLLILILIGVALWVVLKACSASAERKAEAKKLIKEADHKKRELLDFLMRSAALFYTEETVAKLEKFKAIEKNLHELKIEAEELENSSDNIVEKMIQEVEAENGEKFLDPFGMQTSIARSEGKSLLKMNSRLAKTTIEINLLEIHTITARILLSELTPEARQSIQLIERSQGYLEKSLAACKYLKANTMTKLQKRVAAQAQQFLSEAKIFTLDSVFQKDFADFE